MNLLQRTLIAGAIIAVTGLFSAAVLGGTFGPYVRTGFLAAFGVWPARSQTVVASTYQPGDGVVPANDFGTSSGERYDPKAMACAHKTLPLGTRLYLTRGRNAAEVVINDRGPFVAGRSLDCTPTVGAALHLDGLGGVHVQFWPPLPRPRPCTMTFVVTGEIEGCP